ncbi:hypothetical protein B484DRAFT_453421 [Ochromonadaceae sp. CCMP2298]|nr:hypothetical protein B484DRAFT_453421 [Ochromonadaceae sp. CCMP2298]
MCPFRPLAPVAVAPSIPPPTIPPPSVSPPPPPPPPPLSTLPPSFSTSTSSTGVTAVAATASCARRLSVAALAARWTLLRCFFSALSTRRPAVCSSAVFEYQSNRDRPSLSSLTQRGGKAIFPLSAKKVLISVSAARCWVAVINAQSSSVLSAKKTGKRVGILSLTSLDFFGPPASLFFLDFGCFGSPGVSSSISESDPSLDAGIPRVDLAARRSGVTSLPIGKV